MNIAATQFTLSRRTFEIYLSGCTLHCKNCHNPELWDFNVGVKFTPQIFQSIIKKIEDAGELITEIHILGGEPLDNGQELYWLAQDLYEKFPEKKLVLFTGYNLQEIRDRHPSAFNLFDKIKFGRYIEELKVEGNFLASSNQGIWYSRKELGLDGEDREEESNCNC